MNIVNKSIQWLHKVTGLIIAIFFIMWFVTGIVLLYHDYPRVTSSDRYIHSAPIPSDSLPSLSQVAGLSDSVAVKTLSVKQWLGETVWTISGLSNHKDNPMASSPDTGGDFVVIGDTLVAPKEITRPILDSIASVWASGGTITKVDILNKRQQWIMYERYEKSLPILRYHFDNPEKSEIFISQKSGEVLQATTKSERIWSWLGAIPHKLYIPALRKDVKVWEDVLLIGGLFCLVAALSGMYIGIYYTFINKKKNHRTGSPFKKKIWKYHHVSGLIFGIFLIAWGISGSLAMQRVPKWLVNYDGDYFVNSSKLWGKKPLDLGAYKLDYRDLFSKYNDIKSISWEHFGDLPTYLVVNGDQEIYIDASVADEVRLMNISKEEIENAVKRYFGDDVDYTISEMNEYDEYYLSQSDRYPLPVWKIDVENKDGSRLYVSPATGYVKYLNKNRMTKKWLFSATHFLGIKYFVLHNSLRYVCLWILSAGCVFVCVTGLCIYFSKTKVKHKKH